MNITIIFYLTLVFLDKIITKSFATIAIAPQCVPAISKTVKNDQKVRLLDLVYKEGKSDEFVIAINKDANYHTVAVTKEYVHDNTITEILTTELRMGVPTQSETSLSLDGMKRFMNLIHEKVDFAIAEDAARGHFNKKIRDDLIKWGDEYALQSKYIAVYEKKNNENKGDLLGTLRLIIAPYIKSLTPAYPLYTSDPNHKGYIESIRRGGTVYERNFHIPPGGMKGWGSVEYPTLPEEVYLSKNGPKIRFHRPAIFNSKTLVLGNKKIKVREGHGEIGAPGIWALKKKINRDGLPITIAHLINFAIDPLESKQYNEKGKLFYTIADKPLLYESLGFKKVKYNIEVPNGGWLKSDKPIEKDGLSWHVLAIDSGGLKNILVNITENRRSYSKEQELQIREFLNDLLNSSKKLD